MKTLYYYGKERAVTKELITEILEDETITSNMGAGYDKKSNNTIELVRGYEFYELPLMSGKYPNASKAEIADKVSEIICKKILTGQKDRFQ